MYRKMFVAIRYGGFRVLLTSADFFFCKNYEIGSQGVSCCHVQNQAGNRCRLVRVVSSAAACVSVPLCADENRNRCTERTSRN